MNKHRRIGVATSRASTTTPATREGIPEVPVCRTRRRMLPITESGRMAISGQIYMATGGQNLVSADGSVGQSRH
jgi:hypothetical protein